jgi:hypothetical protein
VILSKVGLLMRNSIIWKIDYMATKMYTTVESKQRDRLPLYLPDIQIRNSHVF